jgi:hypothetical protein
MFFLCLPVKKKKNFQPTMTRCIPNIGFFTAETVTSGLPTFMLPPFWIPAEDGHQVTNSTEGEHVETSAASGGQNFLEILSEAGSSIIIIPLIGILELMAICKTFGKSLDKTNKK